MTHIIRSIKRSLSPPSSVKTAIKALKPGSTKRANEPTNKRWEAFWGEKRGEGAMKLGSHAPRHRKSRRPAQDKTVQPDANAKSKINAGVAPAKKGGEPLSDAAKVEALYGSDSSTPSGSKPKIQNAKPAWLNPLPEDELDHGRGNKKSPFKFPKPPKIFKSLKNIHLEDYTKNKKTESKEKFFANSTSNSKPSEIIEPFIPPSSQIPVHSSSNQDAQKEELKNKRTELENERKALQDAWTTKLEKITLEQKEKIKKTTTMNFFSPVEESLPLLMEFQEAILANAKLAHTGDAVGVVYALLAYRDLGKNRRADRSAVLDQIRKAFDADDGDHHQPNIPGEALRLIDLKEADFQKFGISDFIGELKNASDEDLESKEIQLQNFVQATAGVYKSMWRDVWEKFRKDVIEAK